MAGGLIATGPGGWEGEVDDAPCNERGGEEMGVGHRGMGEGREARRSRGEKMDKEAVGVQLQRVDWQGELYKQVP